MRLVPYIFLLMLCFRFSLAVPSGTVAVYAGTCNSLLGESGSKGGDEPSYSQVVTEVRNFLKTHKKGLIDVNPMKTSALYRLELKKQTFEEALGLLRKLQSLMSKKSFLQDGVISGPIASLAVIQDNLSILMRPLPTVSGVSPLLFSSAKSSFQRQLQGPKNPKEFDEVIENIVESLGLESGGTMYKVEGSAAPFSYISGMLIGYFDDLNMSVHAMSSVILGAYFSDHLLPRFQSLEVLSQESQNSDASLEARSHNFFVSIRKSKTKRTKVLKLMAQTLKGIDSSVESFENLGMHQGQLRGVPDKAYYKFIEDGIRKQDYSFFIYLAFKGDYLLSSIPAYNKFINFVRLEYETGVEALREHKITDVFTDISKEITEHISHLQKEIKVYVKKKEEAENRKKLLESAPIKSNQKKRVEVVEQRDPQAASTNPKKRKKVKGRNTHSDVKPQAEELALTQQPAEIKYTYEAENHLVKSSKKFTDKIKKKLTEKIEEISEHPLEGASMKRMLNKSYRVARANVDGVPYRIIYVYLRDQNQIVIYDVDLRRDIYDKDPMFKKLNGLQE